MVITGFTVEAPGVTALTRTSLTVPVAGAQVMLYTVPEEMEVGIVAMVNLYVPWAAARTARALAVRKDEKRILVLVLCLFSGGVLYLRVFEVFNRVGKQ
jgi:hypothetical protein